MAHNWNVIPDHDPNNMNPVLLILNDRNNAHTHRRLYPQWHTIQKQLLNYEPNLRIVIHTFKRYGIITPKIPPSVIVFDRWLPTVVLIPGYAWNEAMTDPHYDLKSCSFILNGYLKDGEIRYIQQFKWNGEDFVRWLIQHMNELYPPVIKDALD